MKTVLVVRFWIAFLIAALLSSSVSLSRIVPVEAQGGIPWPKIRLVKIAPTQGNETLTAPVQVTHAGDGSGRIFIVEQPGRIRILQDGQLLPTPFLDLAEGVLYRGEQGLLGLAFPPGPGLKDHFYVYYTDTRGDNLVARYAVSTDPNLAEPASKEVILPLAHPEQTNHNGGQIAFGPDGYLYIATGDGGGAGDPGGNAQDPGSLLGKLLRIDVETETPSTNPGPPRAFLPLVLGPGLGAQSLTPAAYIVPAGNPFIGLPGFREEIWALGLRNPWRFSFDRLTGDLYLGDVGQGSWEEVDFQPAASPGGENYGWNRMEGPDCYNASSCSQAGLTLPVAAYPTHAAGSCAVTGGFVYRGSTFPALQGIYFYADYCNGKIWGLQRSDGRWVSQELPVDPTSPAGFGEDEAGELYLADHSGGIYQIILDT